ncbi:hypothetical protein SAMN05444920_12492 [Nonomuraea solani]|uniref:Uncharacterized protein n=1 Tax=Nonomuraea solani TaxID=1144553 RepID=A0A1H6EWE6_9ACTN|nr:hypothetical protein [Nonomuraea solani]SEH02157.1 hypothetical protein SAMN05444920_12492 [Nonomuraea solani]
MSFKTEQIARLAESGWAQCASVAEAVARARLPAVTPDYVATAFPDEQWDAAERAVHALRDHFASARFADETTYGILLVPDPGRLDTRRPMAPAVRADQLGAPAGDVFDERLPEGVLGIRPGPPWTMAATVTGAYGPSLGSYDQVVAGEAFTVAGTDTRALMIRQLWGARVLQGGRDLPDCEANERWTFTLFPGEELTDGRAESGTVLKGRVRFRLGKPDRGIGSARVAPAIALG